MVDAVVSSKYGKRPVLDVPPLKAYGGRNSKFNSISSMMDYNTSSLIKQPQQPAIQYVPQQQPTTYVSQPQQITQYVPQAQQPYVSQPQQQATQYAMQPPPQTVPQQTTQYPTVPQQPAYTQPTGYNPYASAYTDPRAAATAPQYPPPDPNSFMTAMMNQFNPFNPTNALAAPLVPPPVPGQFPPPPPNYPPPPPNYPPPEFNRNSFSQPTYAAPPAMAQPVRPTPDDNFSISGKLEFGKMTTVHVDSITGNFKQLPEILRRELKRTYGRYPETDIKISVENGEYHIYASPHRDDDRPIRGPRSYEEDDRRHFDEKRHFDDRRSYDHDDYKRQPRNSNDEFKPKRKDYDQDFVRGRGFEQEPRRRTEFDEFRGRDSRMTDAEWVLVKRR